MLTTVFSETPFQKMNFKTNAIQKVFLEDDIVKIEYFSKSGMREDLFINSYEQPDLLDLEYFFENTIKGYNYDQFNTEGMERIAKALYAELLKNFDDQGTGFSELKNIKYARFIIQETIDLTSWPPFTQSKESPSFDAIMSKVCYDAACKMVVIEYRNPHLPQTTSSSHLILKENQDYDLDDFKLFYSCFPHINFDELTFDYVKRFCSKLYQLGVQRAGNKHH